jgi:ABC-type bacteriocin/lantibiotic exporter with double-glycine peptidase domain
MWPWRKQIEVVLASEAGDDATATLTMMLRYHRRSVTIDEVRKAVHDDGVEPPDALHVVQAAERFRCRCAACSSRIRGCSCIFRCHASGICRQRPRRFRGGWGGVEDGFFVVVAAIAGLRVRWIDPYSGPLVRNHRDFLENATGVFLVFDKAHAIPQARRLGDRGPPGSSA